MIAHVAVPVFDVEAPRLAYARRWAVSNLCKLKDPGRTRCAPSRVASGSLKTRKTEPAAMAHSLEKYAFPHFLVGRCAQLVYERWLRAKTAAHIKRVANGVAP